MTSPTRRILVVGGGPAGAVAAFWLAKAGFAVTVAERATNKFAYGQGIDITGPAVDIVRNMGVYDMIRSRATGEGGFTILDDNGNPIATLGVSEGENGAGFTLTQELEIMRGDITQISADAANVSDQVTYRYGCTVTGIAQTATHITAMLSDTGKPEDFAAIISADGMMSKTRRMVFDPEITKNCFRGIDRYSGFFSLKGQPEDIPRARLQHVLGRRAILVRPVDAKSSERASCYLVYTKKSQELEKTLESHRPSQGQKEIFAKLFKGVPGPLAERALQGLRDSDDFDIAQTA